MISRIKKSKKQGTKGESQTQTLQNRVRDVFRRGLQWKWDRETGSTFNGQGDPQRNGASSQGNETTGSPSQKHWPHFAPVAIQKFRRLFSTDNANNVPSEPVLNISGECVDDEKVPCTSSLNISIEQQSKTDMVKMKTPDKKDIKPIDFGAESMFPDTSSLPAVSVESTSQQETISKPSEKPFEECVSTVSPTPAPSTQACQPVEESENLNSYFREKQSLDEATKASEENLNRISKKQPTDCDVDKNELFGVAPEADSDNNNANELLDYSIEKTDALSCPENDIVLTTCNKPTRENVCEKSITPAALPTSDVVMPYKKGSTNPSIVLSTTDKVKTSDQTPKMLLEPLYLNIEASNGSGMHSRKSPVTVQEWVDSIPLSPHLEEDPEHTNTEELSLNVTEPRGIGDVCPSVTVRPASGQSGTAADQRREAFSRDVSPSLQSDTGSHGSSVDSYLEARRPDPEEVLLGLGFGGPLHNAEAEVSRIPARFLQQSKVKGVAIDDFLRYQQELIETFESGYSGYRGLTGGAQIPSVIVAKIMEKLREHDRESSIKSSAGSSPGHHADISKRRFSRAAQRITILTKMKSRDSIASGPQAHSVLNPDNRKFLDNQGSKSPEVLRKRMIIGHRSFTFDGDGQLIETENNSEEACAPETTVPSKPPPPRPLVHKDSVISSATSLSLTSYDSDSDTDEASGGGNSERNNGETSSGATQDGFNLLSVPVGVLNSTSNNVIITADGSNLDKRRLSLPSSSDLLLSSRSPLNMSDQSFLDRNEVSNVKEIEMLPSSTPESGRSWRDLQRVNSAPVMSPFGEASAFSVLQTHKEEHFSTPDDLAVKNGRLEKQLKHDVLDQFMKMSTTAKTIQTPVSSKKISPVNTGEVSNYQISDFTLPDEGTELIHSPDSLSSPSAENPHLTRLFSMPKSSSMFLDKELRRKLSLNSSVDSYVAKSVANTPDLRNWSTSSVSSWESEREPSLKIDNGEDLDEDHCVFQEQNSLSATKVLKSDSNAALNRRRGSLKRQQRVEEEDPSSLSNLNLGISNLATDKGDSFEMEELAVEEEGRGFRAGSAHSDSSGFQEEPNHNKERPPRATLGKQLSESEPMLNTQLFSDENGLSHSVEHLKRLSLPVIRVQDELGLTQWRASSICGENFSLSSSMRRVQSLPAQISRLGLGRFSESISPGSMSDSIGNMFSSCSDESVIHLPRKSIDVTSESDQTDLPSLPAAILDYKGEVEPLRTPRECCKCNCALHKSLQKCHNDFSHSQEDNESFGSVHQCLIALKEAQSQMKEVMHQVKNHLCSSNECNMNAALEQVSVVMQHQSKLCQQLEHLNLDSLSSKNNSSVKNVCNTSCSNQKSEGEESFKDSAAYEHSPENCVLLCQVVEKENRKLQDLVRLNAGELAQVRVLLERLLPVVKNK